MYCFAQINPYVIPKAVATGKPYLVKVDKKNTKVEFQNSSASIYKAKISIVGKNQYTYSVFSQSIYIWISRPKG